ncbi:MAG: SixA phosphatase family protein [Steroidobacteraceae bacterium]
MELLIVRHGVAYGGDSNRWPDDRQRPLTAEGTARARQAAGGLKRLVDRPQLLLTSPFTRAKQTAAILTAYAAWPNALDCSALSPGESPEVALDAIRAEPQNLVAIVGHQPGLGRLIAACLPGKAQSKGFELETFGAALLSFDGAPRAERAVLIWLLTPSIIRRLR